MLVQVEACGLNRFQACPQTLELFLRPNNEITIKRNLQRILGVLFGPSYQLTDQQVAFTVMVVFSPIIWLLTRQYSPFEPVTY